MDETLDKLGEIIAGALPGSITSRSVANGELTIHAVAGDIVKLATFLRDDERCQFLSLRVRPGPRGACARARAIFPIRNMR